MRIKPTTIAVAFLALAACDPQPKNEAQITETVTDRATTAPTTEATPAPVPDIPAALRGRWGLTTQDCTSERGDAKGLLVIVSDSLKFYESRGVLKTLVERKPGHITADFAFSGEGMTWSRRVSLDLQQGGETMIRRDFGDDAAPGELRYRRCPA